MEYEFDYTRAVNCCVDILESRNIDKDAKERVRETLHLFIGLARSPMIVQDMFWIGTSLPTGDAPGLAYMEELEETETG